MKSIKFPGCTLEIGKGQPEYDVLHAARLPGPQGELLMCFELTDEEIAEIVRSRKIYYSRLTFDNLCQSCGKPLPFQPMNLWMDNQILKLD